MAELIRSAVNMGSGSRKATIGTLGQDGLGAGKKWTDHWPGWAGQSISFRSLMLVSKFFICTYVRSHIGEFAKESIQSLTIFFKQNMQGGCTEISGKPIFLWKKEQDLRPEILSQKILETREEVQNKANYLILIFCLNTSVFLNIQSLFSYCFNLIVHIVFWSAVKMQTCSLLQVRKQDHIIVMCISLSRKSIVTRRT